MISSRTLLEVSPNELLLVIINVFDLQLHLDAALVEKPKEHEVDWFAEHTGAQTNNTELAFTPQVTSHSFTLQANNYYFMI